MANTTDLMIVCNDEPDKIAELSKITGIDFLQVSDSSKCGGSKVVLMEAYAACYKSLGPDKIEEIIEAFKSTNFLFPEHAVMIIDDDDNHFNGVIKI